MKRKFYPNIFILLVMILMGGSCKHATEPSQAPDHEPNIFVPFDEAPSPIGGFGKIQQELQYPSEAYALGIEGRVIVQVQIDSTGEIIDLRNIKSLGYGCDQESMRAILSQQWTPAHLRSKPVKVWVAIPVIFKLL